MDVTAGVQSVDVRTGERRELGLAETSSADLDAAVRSADAAARAWASWARSRRAGVLDALAAALADARAVLVAEADRETGLGEARLQGELTRTAFQLSEFAAAVRDGAYLEATIDHAGPTPMGPRPDLRRMLVPLGAVAVYAASNFPFAFSVLGGDTASALAAGNSVFVKAHPGHPATSAAVAEVASRVLADAGAPDGLLTVVHGFDAGTALVRHPRIRAAGFTGSLAGGRALADAAASRPDPIPFYGELGSVNPVLVTPQGAAARAVEFGEGLAGSVLQGGGQICTKPGLAFVPSGSDGDRLVDALARAISVAPALPALTAGMADAYRRGVDERSAAATIRARGAVGSAAATSPALAEVSARDFSAALAEECFGPFALVVRYERESQVLRALEHVPGSLTATILTAGEHDRELPLARQSLSERAGRVLFDGYPTGVAVAWAQHHGGPWPATNSLHTSVGMTAMRRFLRPIAWQGAPSHALPEELRDGPVVVPTRIDGAIALPGEAGRI